MTAHSHIADLIEIVLNAVAQEARTTQEHLSVEVESVVTRGLLEAFKRGGEHEHDRPTEPPVRSLTPPRGMQAVRTPTPAGPMPVVRPRTPSQPTQRIPTPQPRPRSTTPMPRVKDRRRDDDEG